MKQFKYTDKDGNKVLIDLGGNHFINGKCINPKAGVYSLSSSGQIGDTHDTPDYATGWGGICTGHITKPIQYKDEFKGIVTIKPQR